jgi:hypothetical protein
MAFIFRRVGAPIGLSRLRMLRIPLAMPQIGGDGGTDSAFQINTLYIL